MNSTIDKVRKRTRKRKKVIKSWELEVRIGVQNICLKALGVLPKRATTLLSLPARSLRTVTRVTIPR